MVAVAILSSGDIGGNLRLLRHAESFSRQEFSVVFIIGAELSHLPRSIQSAPNIQCRRLHQLVFPFPLNLFFSPISFLFVVFQCVMTFLGLPHLDLIMTSTEYSLLDVLICRLFRWRNKCKFVYEVAPFRSPRAGAWTSRLEWTCAGMPGIRIVSSRSMQILLEMNHIPSYLLRSPPGTQFYPSRDRRSEIAEFLGVDPHSYFVAIPLPDMAVGHVRLLTSIAAQLDPFLQRKQVWVLFGDGKGRISVESALKSRSFSNITFRDHGIYTEVYSRIMGASDLGICLESRRGCLEPSHELISMSACHLPILAFSHACACEHVEEGKTGFLFRDESSLCAKLREIFIDRSVDLEQLQRNCDCESEDWETAWKRIFAAIV
jgi:hypothetical protein